MAAREVCWAARSFLEAYEVTREGAVAVERIILGLRTDAALRRGDDDREGTREGEWLAVTVDMLKRGG